MPHEKQLLYQVHTTFEKKVKNIKQQSKVFQDLMDIDEENVIDWSGEKYLPIRSFRAVCMY